MYRRHSFLAHLAMIRSVMWIIAISMRSTWGFLGNTELIVIKLTAGAYQFYVLFTIYAYSRFLEGLKEVS